MNLAHRKNLIGGKIRNIRRSKKPNVSQDDLVGKLAVQGITIDRTAISRIENSERTLLDYEIIAIARALNVKIEVLFEDFL